MNDLNKIRELSVRLIESLSVLDLGEILLIYHVITQAIKVLSVNNEEETLGILNGLKQNIFDEIASRISTGEINIRNAEEFHDSIMEKYHSLKNTKHFKEIEKDLNGLAHKDIDFKKDMEIMAEQFSKQYRQIFNVRPKRKRKIPSPDEIINGKQIDGLPNN